MSKESPDNHKVISVVRLKPIADCRICEEKFYGFYQVDMQSEKKLKQRTQYSISNPYDLYVYNRTINKK